MTVRERFTETINGRMPADRMPMIEWAAWWDATIRRWEGEGFPQGLNFEQSLQYFGLDDMRCIGCTPAVPRAQGHGVGVVANEEDYERVRKDMYGDKTIEHFLNNIRNIKPRHDNGDIVLRIWLDGFFWFPRTLFGIEPHFYAFYDYPELMHTITKDLCDFNMRVLTELFKIMKPDFIGYAEDMSYNHGPMVSKATFDEFILPHYQILTEFAHKNGVKTLLDSDGDIMVMIPWFENAGIDGVYPLEHQAGVDIVKIREQYPKFIMLGGYDKMVMNRGEEAIRGEFERILPVMRSGYYIPSVDHQTPPGVSFEDYKLYVKIFKEYCEKTVL